MRPGGEDAEDAARLVGQALEGAAVEPAGANRAKPCENALAGGERGHPARLGLHQHQGRRTLATPLHRASDRVAVLVGAGDLHHGRVGDAVGCGEALVAGGRDLAAAAEALEDALQGDLMLRAEAEMAGDLALADPARGLADEGADVVAGGERLSPRALGHATGEG